MAHLRTHGRGGRLAAPFGIRGYMQVPLEARYGPVAAIVVGSVFFALIHLAQPWAAAILPHLLGLSALLGLLAYTSRSLVPAIAGHTVLDVCNFSYWWSDVAGSFDRRPIGEVGVDLHFGAWLLVFAVAMAVFVLSIWKLRPIGARSVAT